MSDSDNKPLKWHLKTKEPVHGMDLGCEVYCKREKYIPEKTERPFSQPVTKKRTKNKPR